MTSLFVVECQDYVTKPRTTKSAAESLARTLNDHFTCPHEHTVREATAEEATHHSGRSKWYPEEATL